MGCDQDRRAQPVQFPEQADQPCAHFGIDIAGGFVGDQQVGPRHHGAGDGDALLLAAGQGGRAGLHPVAQPHPGQQFPHVMGVFAVAPSRQPEGQRHIVVGRKMIQQPEILEHHADAAAKRRQIAAARGGKFLPEQGDEPPGRRLGQIDQLQKRGLARAGQAGQEGEGAAFQLESDIAQHFGPGAVPHADIFKANHGADHSVGHALRSSGAAPIFGRESADQIA